MATRRSIRKRRPQPGDLDPVEVSVPVQREALDEQPRWSKAMTLTIDGPAGSGKSTVARLVAETLGFNYVDTGATYRALAWLALDRGIPLDDGARLRGLAIAQPAMLGFEGERWAVRIAGRDVTADIREPRIDEAASKVARHDGVRDVLVARQRQLSMARDSVLDGRDCGTRVRPDADLKVFVTADFDERVRRRGAQKQGGNDVANAIKSRDERDAPQSGAAKDAVTVDTTNRSIDEVVEQIVALWIERRRALLDDEITGGRTAREWIENDTSEKFDRVVRLTEQVWKRGFRLQAHGVSRVPDRNCLFIANHASVWDPAFLIVPLERQIRYMGKKELTSTKVIGYFGDAIGFFPVRRGAGDRVALHIGEELLRRGDSLGLFPEGPRVYEGRLARPKQGAARMALVTGVPIVPVAIYGNRWSESLFRVSVAFGRPHYFDGWRANPANIAKATDIVWHDVQELWDGLKADRWF
jgi:cytidylate kinase